MEKNPHFFLSVFVLCFFFFRVFCVSFSSFFVLLLPLILLLLLLLNDQIANFLGAFNLFQGKELCFFSYVVKSFWYALILLRHTLIKTEKKGVVSKTIYHIRQNRVIYLKIKLEMAINAHFCQFSSSASFSSVFFVYLFLLLLLLLLWLLLLLLILLLLLLNDQIANLFGAFILCKVSSVFSYCVKNFWYDPLFCCVIHELRPKGRGRIKNFLPHKTKQSSFPWNKARNGQ